MTCPVCGGAVRVIHCRSDCESVYRKRQCKNCDYVFYTTESESESARKEYKTINADASRKCRSIRKSVEKRDK